MHQLTAELLKQLEGRSKEIAIAILEDYCLSMRNQLVLLDIRFVEDGSTKGEFQGGQTFHVEDPKLNPHHYVEAVYCLNGLKNGFVHNLDEPERFDELYQYFKKTYNL